MPMLRWKITKPWQHRWAADGSEAGDVGTGGMQG